MFLPQRHRRSWLPCWRIFTVFDQPSMCVIVRLVVCNKYWWFRCTGMPFAGPLMKIAGLSYLFSVCYQQSMVCVAPLCICLNMLIVLVAPSRLILEKWMKNMGLTCIMLTYVNVSCKQIELLCNVGSFTQTNHVLHWDMAPSFEKATSIVGPSCLCP